MQEEFSLSTSKSQEMLDITQKVQGIVSKSGVSEGLCNVFCRHSTAAVIINENYDPGVCDDILSSLSQLVPRGKWKHDAVDGNADAHIKSAMLGPSETIPVKNGRLCLGKWQAVMFCELDGPRHDRKVIVTVAGGKD